MAGAVSRWVRYPISASTYVSSSKVGNPGRSGGSALTADSVTIPGSTSNQLKIELSNSGAPAPYEITLSSGTSLCPRFIALDMQRKIQALYSTVAAATPGYENCYRFCQVEYSNYASTNGYGQFVVRDGTTGVSSAVAVTAGTSSVLSLLGMNSLTTVAGNAYHLGTSTANSAYGGTVTVSGTYQGLFDDTYLVVITDDQPISSTVTYGVGNTYGVLNGGVAAVTGDWNYTADATYVVTIDTTNGSTTGGGTGHCPTFVVTMTVGTGDTVATAQEILYPDHYYAVGTRGVYIKFTDYPFGNGDTFTIACTAATDADGASNATAAAGVAKYRFSSRRGDKSSSSTTTAVTPTNVGTKGVTIAFTAGTLTAGDEWRIFCRGPAPEAYGVTSMDYGNVTVTTNSAVKAHQFEIMSGAVALSSVKFSLQSHGTFSHHDAGDSDTEFHFGTVGAGYRGDGSGGASTGPEWPPTAVTATDISATKTGGSTGAPVNLYASQQDLAVVASADLSETVGSYGLLSDVIFTAIKLGASETGSNSTINMRLYFDYSS